MMEATRCVACKWRIIGGEITLPPVGVIKARDVRANSQVLSAMWQFETWSLRWRDLKLRNLPRVLIFVRACTRWNHANSFPSEHLSQVFWNFRGYIIQKLFHVLSESFVLLKFIARNAMYFMSCTNCVSSCAVINWDFKCDRICAGLCSN